MDAAPPVTWASWSGDPFIVIGLFLAVFGYTYGARALAGTEGAPVRRQVLFFASAVASVLLALASPLHELSERYLFSAHMTQHLLLTLAMPPLLLASLPAAMVRLLLRPRLAHAAWHALTRPVVAYLVPNAVFLVWHLPSLYDGALRAHGVHIAQHLLFMGTGLMLWWPLLSPLPELPRLPHAGRLLFVFLQVVPGMLVGGLIANAERPLYALYAAAPRVLPLTAVQDQQLGAIVMWVGGGLFWLLAFTVIFFAWAGRDSAEQEARRRVHAQR